MGEVKPHFPYTAAHDFWKRKKSLGTPKKHRFHDDYMEFCMPSHKDDTKEPSGEYRHMKTSLM